MRRTRADSNHSLRVHSRDRPASTQPTRVNLMDALDSPAASRSAARGQVRPGSELPFVSLFSGIGGLDRGLEMAGATVAAMCESWSPARQVLAEHQPGIDIDLDVRTFTPDVDHDLIAAGFPCVDLSHAGRQVGIFGDQSGLVEHVFRIARSTVPQWLVLENVPNLLRLGRGAGIRFIVSELEHLGYHWAYRVLDSRAFGVAQRRNRVIVLASRAPGDAAAALLGADTALDRQYEEPTSADASGFYWTEGRRGVGLVRGAVPTLKGGSTLGLPSAPAIWLPAERVGSKVVLPSIEDAEELQGFPRGWTSVAAGRDGKPGSRWKLVGNAVTVGLGEWVGRRIQFVRTNATDHLLPAGSPRDDNRPWPDAATGGPGLETLAVSASRWPTQLPMRPLRNVVDRDDLTPLSFRATRGFLSRIEESGITLDERFHTDLEEHMASMRAAIVKRDSWAASDASRKRMQAAKQKNTSPELHLRRALSDLGLRYRLQVRVESDLRWRSDIVFRGPKVVVDVRGCFWHACPIHGSSPKANADRWAEKLRGNADRDARMVTELTARGWEVVVVWEHEDAVTAAARIADTVRRRRTTSVPALVADAKHDDA